MNNPFRMATRVFGTVAKKASQHIPEICVGLGLGGMFTSVVLAVKATPKAMEKIETIEEELDREPTKLEKVTAAAPCYIPTAIAFATSTGMIVFGTHKLIKYNTALAAAYKVSKDALSDYKEQTEKILGERNRQKVDTAFADKYMAEHPIDEGAIIDTGMGTTLFCDYSSGRYFYHDIQKLKAAINEINRELLREWRMTYNEAYAYLGLDEIGFGRDFGWCSDYDLIDIEFSYPSTLPENAKQPCILLTHNNPPLYHFQP